MKRLKRTFLAAVVCAAGHGWATPAEDFARGEKVELVASSAKLHITAGGIYDSRQDVSSMATVCIDKTGGSYDVRIPFESFGLPVDVAFTGTPIDATHLRLTTNQDINRCVSLNGADRFVRRVTGTLTVALSGLETPTAGTCAGDFAANGQVTGGPEGDVDNQLRFTVESGCGGITIGGEVVVHDITIDALVGKHAPAPAIAVDRFEFDPAFICPSPTRDRRVPGQLQLRERLSFASASFNLSSNNASVVPSPSTATVAPYGTRASFATTVPAGFVGTVDFTATHPMTGATRTTQLVVSNGLQVYGNKCRAPKFLLAKNNLLGVCLACDYRGRLRFGRPASNVAHGANGVAFMSASSQFGSAGWSTLDGKLVGRITDVNGTLLKEFADTRFSEMNDLGEAVGTFVDPWKQTHAPVLQSNGQLKWLQSPTGFGEAELINNDGTIGGWVLDQQNVMRAAIWVNGTLRSLHPQSAQASRVVSLSEDGLAVVQAWDSKGNAFALTHDVKSKKTTPVQTPAGYEGVELVGGNNEGGLRAGHFVSKGGVRTPFIDFGAGIQLVNQLQTNGYVIERLISLSDSGELLAQATFNGTSSVLVFDVQ